MLKTGLFLLYTILTSSATFAADTKPALHIIADASNQSQSQHSKIVVATHGWIEQSPWPEGLALAIRKKTDPNEWLCCWFDWHDEARVINPRDAARYARKKAGPLLAEQILKLSKNPEHVHLIGHSAGSWAISEAAKIIAQKTNASIHLTFLDAYVPLGWDANELGNIAIEPNASVSRASCPRNPPYPRAGRPRHYWADHYLTQDITLNVTNCRLLHAHNVDIGDITPGLKDHRFPFHWYPATVSGKYTPTDSYAGKKLYHTTNGVEYGFARSLEAGEPNWKKSLALPMGKEAIKIVKENKK